MKFIDLALPFTGKGLVLLAVAWTLGVLLLPRTGRADTSLTIVVSNIPSGWGTADGDSIAVIGTLNGWSLGHSATVSNRSL